MPRPGPRPYECVRRAWHSDRHQPIRGSIIQRIFRVVHDNHSSATKKNREWQEKLPIVVLKAEEIMYSKANSETEYMDFVTLWDRVNDAINTIIRRDETTETGDLLPPCVEAALNLGCVPVRASRSQRHSNPRSYLPPRAQEPGSAPPKFSNNITNANEQRHCLPPLQTPLVSESSRQMTLNNNPTLSCNFPLLEKTPSSDNRFMPMESSSLLNVGSVYPLYYGTDFQLDRSKLEFRAPNKSNTTILVGMPIFSSVAEPCEVGCSRNLISCDGEENTSNRISSSAPECDLSLRLGPFSDNSAVMGRSLTHDMDDICATRSREGGKFSHFSPTRKEFSFFPMKSTDDHASTRNAEGEAFNAEAGAFRKRKAPYNNIVEDRQLFWDHTFNQFPGRMKRPGS